jgi:hypothetical protein
MYHMIAVTDLSVDKFYDAKNVCTYNKGTTISLHGRVDGLTSKQSYERPQARNFFSAHSEVVTV